MGKGERRGQRRTPTVSRQSACRCFHAGVAPVPAHQLATGTILTEEPPAVRAGVALYARVSSGDQRADLDRQVAGLTMQATADGLAPTKVVAEVGSGLGGHRTKLLGLLGDPGVGTIVVERRDLNAAANPASLVESSTSIRTASGQRARRRGMCARTSPEDDEGATAPVSTGWPEPAPVAGLAEPPSTRQPVPRTGRRQPPHGPTKHPRSGGSKTAVPTGSEGRQVAQDRPGPPTERYSLSRRV